jgi:hypothetical protein
MEQKSDWSVELDRSVLGKHELSDVLIACHEAAHAVVAEELCLPMKSVRIYDDRRHRGGECRYLDPEARINKLQSSIVVSLAGPAFEKLLYLGFWVAENDELSDGGPTDTEQAREMAKVRLECIPGVGTVDEQIARLLLIARDIVIQNWNLIIALGRELAVARRISGKELRQFIAEYWRAR